MSRLEQASESPTVRSIAGAIAPLRTWIERLLARNATVTALHLLWLAILVGLLIRPNFTLLGATDWGVYFNNGRLLAEGQMPYRDFWDHKTPLCFVYVAAWVLLFGGSYASAIAALIPIYFAWSASVYACYRTIIGPRWPALLAATLATYLAARLTGDAVRNGAIVVLAASFEVASLTLYWKSLQNAAAPTWPARYGWALAAGVCAAAAILTRQAALVGFALPALWWLFNRTAAVFRQGVAVAAGAALSLGLGAIVGGLAGISWHEFHDAAIRFNVVYRETFEQLHSPRELAAHIFENYLLFAAALATFLINGLTRRPLRGLAFCGAALGCALLLRFMSPRTMPFYNFAFFPYLSILAVGALTDPVQWLLQAKRPRLLVFGVLLIGGGLAPLASVEYQRERAVWRLWREARRQRAAAGVPLGDVWAAQKVNALLSDPDQQILVYGNRSWLYLLSGRECPIPHTYSNGMFWKNFHSPAERTALLAQIQTAAPELIVDWRAEPPIRELGALDEEFAKSFQAEILACYEVAEQIQLPQHMTWPYYWPEPITIYRRRSTIAHYKEPASEKSLRSPTETASRSAIVEEPTF